MSPHKESSLALAAAVLLLLSSLFGCVCNFALLVVFVTREKLGKNVLTTSLVVANLLTAIGFVISCVAELVQRYKTRDWSEDRCLSLVALFLFGFTFSRTLELVIAADRVIAAAVPTKYALFLGERFARVSLVGSVVKSMCQVGMLWYNRSAYAREMCTVASFRSSSVFYTVGLAIDVFSIPFTVSLNLVAVFLFR